MKYEIILYWLGTEVDRLDIQIVTMAGLELKIQAYRKWRKIISDKQYKIIVHEKNNGSVSPRHNTDNGIQAAAPITHAA